jgi:hypothetical protein
MKKNMAQDASEKIPVLTMKTIILYTSILSALTAVARAQSQNVTWQTPVTIAGASDVSTQGIYYGSWAPYDGNANTMPVNGVTFQGNSDLDGFSASFPQGDQNGYNGYANPDTANANYNTLLQTAAYASSGSGTIVITWNDLPGHTYLIEAWANDGRGNGRSETFTGGANTSASLDFGDFPGQYIIGTYEADNSGSETITLDGAGSVNGDYPQINLLQIRDITPNANVTWQTPLTISGTSDVSTLGTYFGSWAPQDASATNYPVNGVTFQGFSDLPGLEPGPTLDNGYNGFGSPNTFDPNYNTLLQSGRFSNEGSSPAFFSWSGMRPGDTYLIQFWVNDGRNIGQSRSETITGGANTSSPLIFGSGGSGPGQYIIGTFVANTNGEETLALTAYSTGANPDPQINLFQVRDITAVLAPSVPTITGIAVSGTTLTITATNGPPNFPYVLLESTNLALPPAQWTPVLTNAFDGNGNIDLSTNVINPNDSLEFYILQTQ